MDFSIIIPLYNEQKNVEALISSLLKLKYDSGLFEIIMVDNYSTDHTAAIVKMYEQILLLTEEKIGSYAARNKGVEIARGRYLCFTDGDCMVHENWLTEARDFIKNYDPDIMAGRIINTEPEKNVYAKYDNLCFLRQDRLVRDNSAATANLVIKKKVFDAAGGFKEKMVTGGDVEFVKRAVGRGFKLLYNERLIVYHKSRTSFAQIRNKLVRFWSNDERYGSVSKKIISLGLLPGARTLTNAYREKIINLKEYSLLLFVSLWLGCSVMFKRQGGNT